MEYKTLKEFWPYYLSEHKHPTNRLLHFIGSSLGLILLGTAIITLNLYFLLVGFVIGYAFAWFGHFIIEKTDLQHSNILLNHFFVIGFFFIKF